MTPETFESKIGLGDMAVITKKKPAGLAAAATEAFTDSDTYTMEFRPEAQLAPPPVAKGPLPCLSSPPHLPACCLLRLRPLPRSGAQPDQLWKRAVAQQQLGSGRPKVEDPPVVRPPGAATEGHHACVAYPRRLHVLRAGQRHDECAAPRDPPTRTRADERPLLSAHPRLRGSRSSPASTLG